MRMWTSIAAAALMAATGAAKAQTVQLGLDVAADFSVAYPITTVPANVRKFVAVVTYGSNPPKKMTAQFVARNGAAPFGISAINHTVPKDEQTVVLHYSTAKDLPLGSYELDVLFDGKPATSLAFTVAALVAAVKLSSPVTLMGPLTDGTEWSYAFQALKMPSPGVSISIPGIKDADPDGWLMATLVRKVAGSDADGIRIEITATAAWC